MACWHKPGEAGWPCVLNDVKRLIFFQNHGSKQKENGKSTSDSRAVIFEEVKATFHKELSYSKIKNNNENPDKSRTQKKNEEGKLKHRTLAKDEMQRKKMKFRRQVFHSESEEDEWTSPDDEDDFDINCDLIADSDYLNLGKDTEVNDFVLVKLLNED
ncbi:hypothetical protein HNY73_019100 [Argiope bruennichi]|uniref:Uncharacterized protein n=1 Tax=Argiope bruennichi TaxID=94029 RepID=A0A8T0EGE7_ARGBR|nr:hypothetical protein HNY73_019100 [Argiope bruennichi]